ncbi:MAG TPA: ion channel [Thermoanaerobaculia bacterium]|nr:ion channel [Thermoanaerobaculia bacterium]
MANLINSEDPNRDLGFGSVVAQSRRRLLNPDGSFNVVREGMSPLTSLSLYHTLLTTTWPRFLSLLVVFYLLSNTLFALCYMACGAEALGGLGSATPQSRFVQEFFFSVQTFATIGYGMVYPKSIAANVVMTIESLVGLLGFALATGILFARFARPTARILFSRQAIIAPYRGITAFEFRIVNARSNQLIDVAARVQLSRFRDGRREFIQLSLERDKVVFFPLAWTVVHPIDERSPLWGMTEQELLVQDVEFLILLTGTDETFAQVVHTRSSYRADEVVWGARFTNLFNPPTPDGVLSIDIGRLHDVERVVLGRALPPGGS